MVLDFLNKEKLHTGFGEEIVDAKSYNDVLVQAGLNWTVSSHDTFTEFNGQSIKIPNTKTIVRTEDQKPLGIVSSKYKLLNNEDAFAFTEELLSGGHIQFIRGGSYKGGSATWLEGKLSGDYSVLGDKTDCYLVFMNSHDGTGSVRCMILPTRIACSNVLNISIRKASQAHRSWRCTHAGDVLRKVDEARAVLMNGSKYMQAIQEEAERLNRIKLPDKVVVDFVNRLYPITDKMSDRIKSNTELRRNELLTVYKEKDDLANLGNTGYRFVSAVADYVDHSVDLRNTTTSVMNRYITVAKGSPLVDKAYSMVLNA